jgi:hypothetical protein
VARKLFRGMKSSGGAPQIERSARGLGVRVGPAQYPPDVTPDADGVVHPGQGMSVAPDDPMSLEPHRRPREHGGRGADPVWEIEEDSLPSSLRFVADSVTHGVIEPASPMSLESYEAALASTAPQWSLVP